MRVSALPEDPGYATLRKLGHKTTITLDGVRLKHVITADEEEGFAEVHVAVGRSRLGLTQLMAENGELVVHRLTGEVRIYAHPDLVPA